jgi:hypothetical protein
LAGKGGQLSSQRVSNKSGTKEPRDLKHEGGWQQEVHFSPAQSAGRTGTKKTFFFVRDTATKPHLPSKHMLQVRIYKTHPWEWVSLVKRFMMLSRNVVFRKAKAHTFGGPNVLRLSMTTA